MKKLFSVIIVFVLLFSAAPLFSKDQTVVATDKTTMYVNAKNDIILRAKPAKDAKRLGTIKNYSKVTVLSSSNDWSYVDTGKTKGYVYTSALISNNPKDVWTSVTGGLLPEDGLKLTYNPSIESDEKETFIVRKDEDWTYLTNVDTPKIDRYVYSEDKERFIMAVANSDVFFFTYDLPLKQGDYTKDRYYEMMLYPKYRNVFVESTTKIVKVKAGTFKNVVILRYPTGERIYFARGIGLVKITDKNGKITTELVTVK